MKAHRICRAACVQMTSGPDIAGNMEQAASLIREAAARGAQLIATPENTCQILPPDEKARIAVPEDKHPALPFLTALARELDVWLIIGSLAVAQADRRIANRSYVIDSRGDIVARYDKIHLFDVDLPSGESHRESAYVAPGGRGVVARTPWGGIGLSICYDVRFAGLYRDLAKAGAQILSIPAAFTVPTGRAHWEILLRARAIETGSFVLAPAQEGTHEGGRKTYGHSMIIGPWGEIFAQRTDAGQGVICADLPLDDVARVRGAIPALQHDRLWELQQICERI